MSEEIQSYRDLRVWQAGMDLAQACYENTRCFPRDEIFGLTSQIRRSSTSIPANIAEGYGRESSGDYARFLQIAQGSLKETETHLLLAARVGLLAEASCSALLSRAEELGRMLRTLIRAIQARKS